MISCNFCAGIIQEKTVYCPSCGRKQIKHRITSKTYFKDLRLFVGFYFLLVIPLILLALQKIGVDLIPVSLDKEIEIDLAFHLYLIVLVTIFALIDGRRLRQVLNLRRVRPKLLLLIIPMAITYGLFVHFAINWLVDSLALDMPNNLEGKSFGLFLIVLIFMAVIPGIFEEIAFRGFLLSQLNTYVSFWAAAFVTSFLFFFIHFAFLSFFWMMPFALGMCWLRKKTGIIWYGIFWHFLHNATVTALQL